MNRESSRMNEMNCSEAVLEIPLYCYGEVSSETEERLEQHLAACSACSAELAKQREFLEMLDKREDAGGEALLASCRNELRAAIRNDAEVHGGWAAKLREFWQFHIPFRVPVGAMAMVALGFVAAHYTPEKFGGAQANIGDPMFQNVRSVEPNASGGVQIAVDEVRRHMVTGSLQDPAIRTLLVNAVREESNPGVRVESIGILKNSADSEEVRGALLDALTHDPNPGVRLKALEGLKPWAGNVTVRRTLANVLLRDDNPGVRVQAIDMLTAQRDDAIVGVLQGVVQKEDNTYVREQTTRLLEAMKASVGTY
jgi:hypothetical protein